MNVNGLRTILRPPLVEAGHFDGFPGEGLGEDIVIAAVELDYLRSVALCAELAKQIGGCEYENIDSLVASGQRAPQRLYSLHRLHHKPP